MHALLSTIDRFFPVRYLAWTLCVAVRGRARLELVADGRVPGADDRGACDSSLVGARLAAAAALGAPQLSGHRPHTLSARIHTPGNSPVLSSRRTTSKRRSRANSVRSSISVRKAHPTSGRSARSSTSTLAGYEWINHSLVPTEIPSADFRVHHRVGAELHAAVQREHLQRVGDELRRIVGQRDPRAERRCEEGRFRARHGRGLRSAPTIARMAAT